MPFMQISSPCTGTARSLFGLGTTSVAYWSMRFDEPTRFEDGHDSDGVSSATSHIFASSCSGRSDSARTRRCSRASLHDRIRQPHRRSRCTDRRARLHGRRCSFELRARCTRPADRPGALRQCTRTGKVHRQRRRCRATQSRPLHSILRRSGSERGSRPEAGRLAGDALGKFAQTTWRGRLLAASILGAVKDPSKAIQARIAGITEGLHKIRPDVVPMQLDSGDNFLDAQAQLRRFLAKESGAMALVATLDDTTALAAKLAAETAGRVPDTVIVSQGCDRSVHGGTSANKVIDPNNRNSIVLGSVAYFLDRYGSEILPLALKMLRGEHLPPRSFTGHVLVTAKNVFRIYPPIDIN